ncbi:50S ribosomal protein L32 [Anaerofustis sp.]|uniref:50S ribosomal protein L32 n=1 Tax=Anaerofustis sp. TaxID=1872517 RepID=UPI0025B9D76C|nr:50S ribosomal protein L32 [Anaerofustis sp.]
MAVPKRKVSKARRDKKRANSYKIEMPTASVCPKCGEVKAPHRVCKVCGTYKDVTVIDVEE